MKLIVGTNYFPFRRDAYNYYRPLGFSCDDINEKIRKAEINLGKPPLKHGQRLVLLDDGLRYGIEE